MTDRDLIRIASGVLEAFNEGDFERCMEPLTADSVYDELATRRHLTGRDEIVKALREWKEAMPDAKGKVTNAFGNTTMAVLEVSWEGTHTGPLQTPTGTIPASGMRQETPSAWVFEFEGDKIKGSRQYFDMLAFMQQIGALPG